MNPDQKDRVLCIVVDCHAHTRQPVLEILDHLVRAVRALVLDAPAPLDRKRVRAGGRVRVGPHAAVRIAARNDKRPIRDGEIMPACAQSCPSRAIHSLRSTASQFAVDSSPVVKPPQLAFFALP